MGVSKSPDELARKMVRAGRSMDDAAKAGTKACAQATKNAILAQAPARLRNVGKNGTKLSVRYNVDSYPDGAKALVFAVGKGWPIIENDTKPHRIPRERGKRAKKRYAVIPGVGVRAYAHHPGTKGKHPFAHGVKQASVLYGSLAKRPVDAALRAVF